MNEVDLTWLEECLDPVCHVFHYSQNNIGQHIKKITGPVFRESLVFNLLYFLVA